jgi:hypothetical protein
LPFSLLFHHAFFRPHLHSHLLATLEFCYLET